MLKNSTTKFTERRVNMHNDKIFPISIEEFASYLDGNLTEDDMTRISSIIDSNSDMHSIAENVQLVDDTFASYSPLELTLPDDISSIDFNIPQIDNIDVLPAGFEEYHSATCCEFHWFDNLEEIDDSGMTLDEENYTEPICDSYEAKCGHWDVNDNDLLEDNSQNEINEY